MECKCWHGVDGLALALARLEEQMAGEEEKSTSESEDSRLTLRKSFFDDLWPLILEDNRCDIKSKNTSEFFEPVRRFDDLWTHSLLASKGFRDYFPPIELRCCKAAAAAEKLEAEANVSERSSEQSLAPSSECFRVQELPAECCVIQAVKSQGEPSDMERRQKLSSDFIHRRCPWYVQRPIYSTTLDITDTLRKEFTNGFEFDVLQDICTYECKLMIIDFGADVCIGEVQRWLKFCRYVQMIGVVRNAVIARKLLLLGGMFYSVLLDENLENSWQEELERALCVGVNYGKALNFLTDCSKAFVFVFSKDRGMSFCDTFKVLRKF